jgi:multidrug efflux pump subunit AcrA (membrane-fusion protein)
MRRRWWVLIVVVVLAVIGFGVIQNQQPQLANTQNERIAKVARGTIRASVSASGSIAPAQKVDLNFSTPGQVADVAVSEGDQVKAGMVLARLDTDE